jgi:hypothetical protein
MKLLPLLLLLLPGWAYSCICSYPPFDEQFAKATYVFAGRVLKIEPGGQNRLVAQFKILKAYKGVTTNEMEVRTDQSSAACGYPFELQSEYLVYATGKEQPEVSLCSRSKILKQAKEDLDLLEKRSATQKQAAPSFSEKKETQKKDAPKNLTVANAVIVGITKKPDGYVALIRAKDNKVHFLEVGDKLHDGTVLAITDDAVTFRQFKGYRSVLVKKEFRPRD